MTLPALGESVTEGTVTRWLKQVGDDVAVDEPLLEVSTDKVDTEIPSPVAGKLLEIKVEEDETVEVGAELAVIGSGERSPRSRPSPRRSRPTSAEAEKKEQQEAEQEEAEPEARARARGRSRSPRRSRSRPRSRSPRRRRRPRRRTATSPRRTSLPWSARWPPSTASTWRP